VVRENKLELSNQICQGFYSGLHTGYRCLLTDYCRDLEHHVSGSEH